MVSEESPDLRPPEMESTNAWTSNPATFAKVPEKTPTSAASRLSMQDMSASAPGARYRGLGAGDALVEWPPRNWRDMLA